MELQNGKTYRVNHSRKGTFVGRLIATSGEWVTLEITNGKAKAMKGRNEREAGEEVTVRRSFCSFTEQPD